MPPLSASAAFGRFDTRTFASAALLAAVADGMDGAPARVLDLGSGGGALALAARKVWPDVAIVALDIDPDATTPETAGARQVLADALRDDLSSLGRFDIVLCNPPYLPLPPDHPAGTDLVGRGRARGMEAAFALRALDLARPGGRVGLIMPEAAASGEAYRCLRELLVDRHALERVVALPRGAFARADPSARLFVLTRNGGRSDLVRIGRLSIGGDLEEHEAIPAAQAAARCDLRGGGKGPTLAELGVELVRGSLCPGRARREGIICVHTTDLVERAATIVLPDGPRIAGLSTAAPGDILLARVGRNLHRKISLVISGEAPITDCVFRLRVSDEHRAAAFAAVTADAGETLRKIARGTGAVYLVRQDILDLRMP